MTGPVVHVVAGVLRDARGRILLARRTRGRDLAGLWEFPGGKVEAGETPQQALVRELQEELGVDVDVGAQLINVPQQYPGKRLHLDVYAIDAIRGKPKGLDGQALVWAPQHTLPTYPMPPADRPVVAALLQPDRCLITPPPRDSDAAWLDALQQAFEQGVRRVQLRAPGIEAARWRALVEQAVALCGSAGVEVLLNGDAETAAALGIGLHLRASQLRDWPQRGEGEARLLAASCHDEAELRQAERIGCDFVLLGPVAPTASHPDASPLGWDGFARLREQVALPIYALGGMDVDDIRTARDHGAQGVAAIRGLWPA